MADHAIPTRDELTELATYAATRCGVTLADIAGPHETRSPVNGEALLSLEWADASAADQAVDRAQEAFLAWRSVPAPARGALVKRLGELLTVHKNDLATLISIEAGK